MVLIYDIAFYNQLYFIYKSMSTSCQIFGLKHDLHLINGLRMRAGKVLKILRRFRVIIISITIGT